MNYKEPVVTLVKYQQLEQHHEELLKHLCVLEAALADWIMMVLAPTDAPSPSGIYYPRKVSPQWKQLIQSYSCWSKIVYLEEFTDEITGEKGLNLWRLIDWQAAEPQRREKVAQNKLRGQQLTERRYRVWRTQQQLCKLGMGRKTALDMIKNICSLEGKLPNALVMLDQLTPLPFSAPIDPEEFEEFSTLWRTVAGHVYEDEYDLKGNEV